MVASGFFPDATAVSPYRLVDPPRPGAGALRRDRLDRPDRVAAHAGAPAADLPPAPSRASPAASLVALTIVAGGFVAGTHAGLDYNTFPLMDGQLVPDGYARLTPFLRNLTENIAAVQFDHRLLATLTALVAAAHRRRRLRRAGPLDVRLPIARRSA